MLPRGRFVPASYRVSGRRLSQAASRRTTSRVPFRYTVRNIAPRPDRALPPAAVLLLDGSVLWLLGGCGCGGLRLLGNPSPRTQSRVIVYSVLGRWGGGRPHRKASRASPTDSERRAERLHAIIMKLRRAAGEHANDKNR